VQHCKHGSSWVPITMGQTIAERTSCSESASRSLDTGRLAAPGLGTWHPRRWAAAAQLLALYTRWAARHNVSARYWTIAMQT